MSEQRFSFRGVKLATAFLMLAVLLAGCGGGGGGGQGTDKGSSSAPLVNSVAPNTGPTGGGTSVIIRGTNFQNGAGVNFGGSTAASVTFVSDTEIQANTPSHAAGAVDVEVTNPDNQAGKLTGGFTYGSGVSITSLSPNSGTVAGGTNVTISGANFLSGAQVTFGGLNALSVTFVSSNQLQAITPARPAGAVNVTVSNPDNTSFTLNNGYTYTSSVNLTNLSPTAGSTLGGTAVVLTGTGFQNGATVSFGGTAVDPANVTFVSSTQLNVVTPAHVAGAVDVVVTNPNNETATLSGVYRYVAPPVVSSVSPNTGSSAGSTTVNVSGQNFQSGATVSFGGTLATTVLFISSTQLQAVTPPHAAGTVDVLVRNPDNQTGTKVGGYTYADTLGITSVSPVSGPTTGGTTVTITGTGFQATPTVSFGGVAATTVNFVSATEITAVTPAHAAGLADVAVTNPGGPTATLPGAFNFSTALTVGSVSPNSGPETGGTLVTITGTGFQASDSVAFGGVPAASVTFINSNQLQAMTPAHTPGSVEVRVSPAVGENDAFLSNGFTFLGSLTVTAVNPNVGPVAGGTSVIITGTFFQPGATVTFGGTPGTSVNVVSQNQINAVTPAHAAGAVDLVVTNPDLTAATLLNGFTYQNVLGVTTISPNTGPATGGTSVTITGTNFQAGATVTIGGTPATGVLVVSQTQITATTPAHAAGAVDVTVTNPGPVSATLAGGFTYTPVLTVTSVSPTSGTADGGDTIAVNGSNFQAGATVLFDTTPAAGVTLVNSTRLSVVTPAHTAATVDITVRNPDNTTAVLPNSFTFNTSKGSNTAPSISNLSPISGPTAGGTTVTITGTNFAAGITVTFGGTQAQSVSLVSGAQLTAVTPAHAQGPVDVVLTNTDGQSGSAANAFTYVGPVSVSNVVPNSGPTAGGTVITINGANFQNGATVRLGGVLATSISFVNSTQLTATTPAHAAGQVDVNVTNPDNQTASLANGFTYLGPPSITTLGPASGPLAGGTLVTITGSGFLAGAVVKFDTSNASNVTVVSATQITALTPAHAAGSVSVSVTNPDGQSATSPVAFTYAAAMTVSSVSPVTGPSAGGTVVTINGVSFQNGASVSFDGTVAASVTFLSSSQLQAVTPPHADGTVDVTVTNPDLATSTLPNAFTYTTATSIGSIVPSSGTANGGTLVTITGTNFQAGITVTFGGTPGTGVTLLGNTQLQVTTPAHAAGAVDVTVTNLDASTATASGGFTYLPALQVTGVAPNTGGSGGGTTVTVTGVSFQPGAVVSFGSSDAASVTFVSTTQLTAVTPAHTAGTVDLHVMNPDGSSATLTNGFTFILDKGMVADPEITGVSPASGPDDGGTVIIITGNNFQPGATVTIGGIACNNVNVLSGSQVECTTPPHAAGAADIVLTNPDGKSFTASGAYFFEGLTVAAVDPTVADIGGGTVLRITGTGFLAGATVLLGGVGASFVTVDSPTQITATAPAHAGGFVDLTVTNPGGETVTLPSAVNYINPPRISAIQPDSGLNTGNTLVTLSGAGFRAGATVLFGGLPGTQVNVISDTQLTVRTPAHSVGPVDVVFTNPDGATTTATDGFRYGQILYQDGFEACSYTAWTTFFDAIDVLIANKGNPLDAPFVRTGQCSSKIHYHICGVTTPPPLTGITQVAGGALPARTYFIKYTYQNTGQTPTSVEQSFAVAAGNLLRIPSPPPQADLQFWNVYLSTTTGTETRQTPTGIPIGTAFTEPVTGLIAGTAPPAGNTCGGVHQDRNRYFEQQFTSLNGFPGGLKRFFARGYFYAKSPEPGATLSPIGRKLYYLKAPPGTGNYLFAVVLSMGAEAQPALNITISNAEVGGSSAVFFTSAKPAFGQWNHLELEVVLNTPGLSDGVLTLYLNGVQVLRRTGLNIRVANTFGITRFEIGRQVDRDNFLPVDEYRFWDDFVVADAYVGP